MEIRSRIELPKLLMHFNLPLIACEIGVEGGHNATDLLKNGIEKIYCIDSWMGDEFVPQKFHDMTYGETISNLSQFESDRYVILRGRSSKMHKQIPNKSIGLLYLDGNHSYENVREDLENYFPKLVSGGIIAAHDYVNIDGVRHAINEFADLHGLTVYIIPESNRGDAGMWMRTKETEEQQIP